MLTQDGYKERIIDRKIERYMNIYGCVCVEGPKYCGKTWTSLNHAVSVIYLGDSSGNFANRKLAEMNPELVLQGENPRLIDEWQTVPSIWDAVKFHVDAAGKKGLFVITGSSTPASKGILHSGTGRTGKIAMRTMSLLEMGKSNGKVSIMDLFNHTFQDQAFSEPQYDDLIEYVLRGGWPGVQDMPLENAMQVSRDYLENIPDDLEKRDGIRRDRRKIKSLIRALGRSESNMTSKKSLLKDLEEFNEDFDSEDSNSCIVTLSEYLDSFSRIFLTEDQPSFENKLRSSVKSLKRPKRHFADPSLAAAAIEASKETLRKDPDTFGYLFESLCVHDLRVYADANNGKIYHYHDERDNEADAVVSLPDGRWGLIEIKLGFNQIEAAALSLLSLSGKFEKETSSKPDFLCVICGLCRAAFRRPDGVYVVPITALAP